MNGPVQGHRQGHRLGMFGLTAPSASVLCLPVGCTSGPDALRGFSHYHEDPADAPSQVPLTSLGGIQLEGPARPPSTGKGSECLSCTKTSIQMAVTQSSELWGREQSRKTPQRRQLMQAEGGEELNGGNSESGKWEIFKMREGTGKRTLRHNLLSWGHLNL